MACDSASHFYFLSASLPLEWLPRLTSGCPLDDALCAAVGCALIAFGAARKGFELRGLHRARRWRSSDSRLWRCIRSIVLPLFRFRITFRRFWRAAWSIRRWWRRTGSDSQWNSRRGRVRRCRYSKSPARAFRGCLTGPRWSLPARSGRHITTTIQDPSTTPTIWRGSTFSGPLRRT